MTDSIEKQIKFDLTEKREKVFLVLAGLFLCAMTMLNIIGITRFVQLGPFALAVGVLPYPLTFLCTDLISELYGRKRANFMVTVGLILNCFIIGTMWQLLHLAEPISLPDGTGVQGQIELFSLIYATTSGAVVASMMAYIAAQYCDVYMFHFWKNLTKGKHLWLRNNGSTIISQGVDSFMVISVTFGAQFIGGAISAGSMLALMGGNYLFKLCVALADTIPFYIGVNYLTRYLELSEEELQKNSN
jgi:hypothetical protein